MTVYGNSEVILYNLIMNILYFSALTCVACYISQLSYSSYFLHELLHFFEGRGQNIGNNYFSSRILTMLQL